MFTVPYKVLGDDLAKLMEAKDFRRRRRVLNEEQRSGAGKNIRVLARESFFIFCGFKKKRKLLLLSGRLFVSQRDVNRASHQRVTTLVNCIF